MEAQLIDPQLIQKGVRFFLLTCVWLTKLAGDPQNKGYNFIIIILYVHC